MRICVDNYSKHACYILLKSIVYNKVCENEYMNIAPPPPRPPIIDLPMPLVINVSQKL